MADRLRHLATLSALSLVLAAGLTPALARGRAAQPTRAQIRAALDTATRSPDLWATVNICNSERYPNVIGIRGQMPALGFASRLVMDFRVDYWSFSDQKFVAAPQAEMTVDVGRAKRGVHQGGIRFSFRPHVGLLRGEVTFSWRLGQQVIGRVTRLTRLGHGNADFADPAGFSSWKCVIP